MRLVRRLILRLVLRLERGRNDTGAVTSARSHAHVCTLTRAHARRWETRVGEGEESSTDKSGSYQLSLQSVQCSEHETSRKYTKAVRRLPARARLLGEIFLGV